MYINTLNDRCSTWSLSKPIAAQLMETARQAYAWTVRTTMCTTPQSTRSHLPSNVSILNQRLTFSCDKLARLLPLHCEPHPIWSEVTVIIVKGILCCTACPQLCHRCYRLASPQHSFQGLHDVSASDDANVCQPTECWLGMRRRNHECREAEFCCFGHTLLNTPNFTQFSTQACMPVKDHWRRLASCVHDHMHMPGHHL